MALIVHDIQYPVQTPANPYLNANANKLAKGMPTNT